MSEVPLQVGACMFIYLFSERAQPTLTSGHVQGYLALKKTPFP